jgi:hypothetical protein
MQNGSQILMSIHAEGPATTGGRMPLAELARIAAGVQVTLERLALALNGTFVAKGRRPRDVVDAVRLDFTGFRSGSAILDIARAAPAQETLPGTDDDSLLTDSLDAFEYGITGIRSGESLPPYFTHQVLGGLRDLAGGVNAGNLTSISFTRPDGNSFAIDSVFRTRLREFSALTPETEATVVGRLQMGDFSPAALRCRIDTFAGSVLADFGADLRDAVLDAMDQMVMANGTAELQPDGATVRVLHLSAIERLPSAPVSPLAALQREQHVQPVSDITELRGHVEDNDDFSLFLEAIHAARHGDQ